MQKKLFLLDGMALVYRAHFALIARPIFTSKGVNTSALYGFTQTLLEILRNQQPTHIAVAFDTEAPTQRHVDFPDYKATRQTMPEDLSAALPSVDRMLQAFNIPAIRCDGYEADDLIGTLVRVAELQGFQSFMVTPDKDFGQLVTPNTFLYKPGRMGDSAELLGVPEITGRWGIQSPKQVIDILALMGDSSDNIPGVPGIGEKTAAKLIGQFHTVEDLLSRTNEVKGKMREVLEKNREAALLSKKLATIICDAPCPCDLESLKLRPPDEDALKALFVEFEFNSIGKRLFGEDFAAGRGYSSPTNNLPKEPNSGTKEEPESDVEPKPAVGAELKTLADVPHDYEVISADARRAEVLSTLSAHQVVSVSLHCSGEDPRNSAIEGIAFCVEPRRAFYLARPRHASGAEAFLQQLRPLLESQRISKTGHDLKQDFLTLQRHGVCPKGSIFDVMIAHSLVEPDVRHSLQYLSESFLGYTPIQPLSETEKATGELLPSAESPGPQVALEKADLTLQLQKHLEPLLDKKGQRRVFYEIESPLVSVLADMEFEGIRVDADALGRFAQELEKELVSLEKEICNLAGTTFNLNSPKQLGTILFDTLKICEAPKKTRTGQYVTDEQTLAALAPEHPIVKMLLDHRTAAKLKSTYADALPAAIWRRTGRVHTTYNQVMTSTGRLNSQNPNLQNIPIRTERGQEIRKAFVPRDQYYLLLSADYSQIELRIIAALSREPGLLEAFSTGADVHTATAARVYNVFPDLVTPEMRRKAKMVNYGIAYGISAFGLAQRLSIPRREASEIIDQYFRQFPRIRGYMDDTIAFARKQGYVETVTGRRRYIRDINSSNGTVRGGAERNAINAPIQGTAADMIKIAMVQIHSELKKRNLKSRILLQVHDELVIDLFKTEEAEVRALVEDRMKNAISLNVPIEVETGVGHNWLEAH